MLVALAALVAAMALARNLNLEDAAVLMGLVGGVCDRVSIPAARPSRPPGQLPRSQPGARDAHEETLTLIALTSDHYRHHDGQVDGDREQVLEDAASGPDPKAGSLPRR